MPETAALITAVILDRPVCLDCIALKAGIDAATAGVSLARIKNVMVVHRDESGRCRACGTTGVVLWLLHRD
jgi:hypothetical protein